MYSEISRLIEMLKSTGKPYNIEKIKSAYLYAKKVHDGQFRNSGEAYISHPIAVAEIVAGLELDTDSICAALLHDTIEDARDKLDLSDIKKHFGEAVALLVDGLTKIVQMQIEDKEEAHIENLRKMLLAMSKDIRVIFIKLCDRLHNMRTLAAKAEEKRRAIALETMYVYAPLAHRLGMQRIKQELENHSLIYLDPIGYEEVRRDIERKYGQNLNFIENVRASVEAKLSENNINFTLEGRIKTVYSIYRKMYNQNKSFDEIYDFYALRIIVKTELECYTVLGIIHEMFNSVPGRFKDYISTPKPNLYQSLHTTVIGRGGIPFEVQIRTREMHNVAEYGIAAHWKYKSGERSKEEIDDKLSWIAKLIEADDNTRDPDEFMHSLKIDIFHDETFVFTPKGDVIALPLGSTTIDFAYAIHSAIGNKMIGAKINGMIVPIDKILQTGDIVEILTSPSAKGPSRDWLKIVKTGEARNKIRQWFKKEKRSENIVVGRNEIDRELRRFGRSYTEQQKHEIVTNVAKRLGIQEADDLYNTIGYGGLAVTKIIGKLRDEFDRVVKPEESEQLITDINQVKITKPKLQRFTGGVVVEGESGYMIKFAKCCNPLPGDDIVGFITRGYGVSIHKQDCPNFINRRSNPQNVERWLEAHWENEFVDQGDGSLYEARVQIHAENNIRLIADITTALAEMRVSILQISSQKRSEYSIIINLTIGCKNVSHYRSIVSKLKSIPSVYHIERGFS
ncbi:MAG: bifunctional (p)ppGpp synthetase/guanosine-3',5'-bis(diphosphate) 3'-pyrophosphohydrolase [Clostridiales bacterium]|nr:bifunctional (p)ppGpp synthetase/guanosine-3',5'-bis(diphosphate) 3'-pyrophosphohydrolase [Clostridiales bacterium]